jgi:hypothetical protein
MYSLNSSKKGYIMSNSTFAIISVAIAVASLGAVFITGESKALFGLVVIIALKIL